MACTAGVWWGLWVETSPHYPSHVKVRAEQSLFCFLTGVQITDCSSSSSGEARSLPLLESASPAQRFWPTLSIQSVASVFDFSCDGTGGEEIPARPTGQTTRKQSQKGLSGSWVGGTAWKVQPRALAAF